MTDRSKTIRDQLSELFIEPNGSGSANVVVVVITYPFQRVSALFRSWMKPRVRSQKRTTTVAFRIARKEKARPVKRTILASHVGFVTKWEWAGRRKRVRFYEKGQNQITAPVAVANHPIYRFLVPSQRYGHLRLRNETEIVLAEKSMTVEAREHARSVGANGYRANKPRRTDAFFALFDWQKNYQIQHEINLLSKMSSPKSSRILLIKTADKRLTNIEFCENFIPFSFFSLFK